MRRYYYLLFFLVVISANYCFAQNWVSMMQNPNINVHEVQKAFYKWYDEYKKGRVETDNKGEDAGIELFKRWETYMVPRTYPSGNRYNPVQVASDFESYKKTHYNNTSVANASWTYIGNTSVPTNGGGDGRVNHIRFFPGNPNIMYACTPSGGLWKSTNGGNTWTTNTDNLGDLSVTDIAIDPNNTNIMYIGTGDNDNPGSGTPTTIGVLRSTDGGNTWSATGLKYTLSYSGQYYMVINQIMIDPDTTNIVWAASSFGLWKSVDTGKTWKNMLNDDIRSIEFEPFHSSVIYATNNTGKFYRSANG
ncbi:MAG TPA: hypothetical protein VN922_09715, partial [Bacteroidia bacterium]|nr:hypothetical protein [Bacteroidia bacterium]